MQVWRWSLSRSFLQVGRVHDVGWVGKFFLQPKPCVAQKLVTKGRETKFRCICLSHVPETTHHGVLKAKLFLHPLGAESSPWNLMTWWSKPRRGSLSTRYLIGLWSPRSASFAYHVIGVLFQEATRNLEGATNSTAKYSKMCHSNPM